MADIYAVIWALVFMGLGLVLAWFAQHACKLESSGLFIALILTPVALFLILSGRVAELGGGGVTAKFREAAARPLSATFPLVSLASGIDEHGEPVTGEAMAFLGGGAQVVFLDVEDTPTTEGMKENITTRLATQIYPSLLMGTFLGLLVTEHDRIIGYFEPHWFYDLLRIEIIQTMRGQRENYQRQKVNDQLRQTMLWDIVEFPKNRAETWGSTKTLHAYDTTNIEALQAFIDKKTRVMPLVDGHRRFVGMVTWEDLISTLLVSTSSDKLTPKTNTKKE